MMFDLDSLAKALKDPHPPVTFLREFFKLVKLAVPDVEYDCCKVYFAPFHSGDSCYSNRRCVKS